MNHRNYEGDRYLDNNKQYPRQLRSLPPHDGSPRSDVATVNGKQRKNDYVPYQDALYYNKDNSASYGSNGSDRDPHDRNNDRRYSEVYERVRRRRRNGTHNGWDDNQYEPNQMPLAEYHGKQRYEDDEPPPPPIMNGHDERRSRREDDARSRRDDDTRSRRGDRQSRSSSSERSRKSRRRDPNHDNDSRSRSRSRSDSPPRNKGPDPNIHPEHDPNRPSEAYTALKALKAAAWSGGVEIVRCRMEPGPWTGQKGKRVALAASVGCVIGALRNGRNQSTGKMPYAEAAMTGFYAIDFLKRVARHTEHGRNSVKEQEEWNRDPEYIQGREERMKKFAHQR